MASYPIRVYGLTFERGDDFHEFIDALHSYRVLTQHEMAIIEYTYDNGYLAHPDYKLLIKKPVTEE